jgi:DNA damage-binding protein 1
MSFNYIVTAHKATAVTITLAGSFTGPDDLNLLQARGSTLAVSQVTPEGLKPVINIDVFGRISAMQLFRPKNEKQDLLFLLTARYHVAILSFDSIQNDVITRAYGDVKDRVGKPTSGKQVALVDPNCQAIVLHLYAGLLKVVPLQFDSHQSLKAFNLRLDDLYIVDMQFIHSTENLTIAYLVEEPNGRVLKTSIISVRDKELLNGPHPPVKTEAQANLLWPISDPHNGMLVIGMESIAYYNAEAVHSIDPPVIKDSIISCVGTVDMSRYLIGDSRGRLLMLFLDFKEDMECEEPLLISMKLEILGEVTSSLTSSLVLL